MRCADFKGIAVGFFDGVHRGHRAILENADTALTFRNHPLSLISPDAAPRLIMSVDDRIAAIRACGVNEVVAVDFTREMAMMSPEDFAAQYLSVRAGASGCKVFCGANWRFGNGGRGDADTLRSLGYEVVTVPYAEYDGAIVSSSRIRGAIESGCIEAANAMLGRSFMLRGSCERGKGVGTALGRPTVNVIPYFMELRLPLGVYEVMANGVHGIANYGFAPTFGERAWKRPVLEVHFLEPGKVPKVLREIDVSLLRFIRPERKFASAAELRRQIDMDIASV